MVLPNSILPKRTLCDRIVWQDAKYVTFHKQITACLEDLERFSSTGLKYADFLREKAMLANRYLHRG